MGSSEVTRVMAAAVAAGTKGGVEQRYQQPDYIDVSGGTGSPQYELLGFGVTQLDNSPAAKTSSKRYVNQKSATQSIGSYEWTAPLEVADFSDNDGEIQGSGNLLAVSDWVEGSFDTTTKTFTEKGAAA